MQNTKKIIKKSSESDEDLDLTNPQNAKRILKEYKKLKTESEYLEQLLNSVNDVLKTEADFDDKMEMIKKIVFKKDAHMQFQIIEKVISKNAKFSVSELCKIAEVSRSEYYAFLESTKNRPENSD